MELQIQHLKGCLTGNDQTFDWRFAAFVHPDDLTTDPFVQHIGGGLMTVGALGVARSLLKLTHFVCARRDGGTTVRRLGPKSVRVRRARCLFRCCLLRRGTDEKLCRRSTKESLPASSVLGCVAG